MNMHIHDCFELYYSLKGGRQFLIDDRCYDMEPGDLFLINHYESHYLSQVDESEHERVVLSISPDYLKSLSTTQTDLAECFLCRPEEYSHRIHLEHSQQKQFMYLIHKIIRAEGYGADLAETAAFTELMVMIGGMYRIRDKSRIAVNNREHNQAVDKIINYINQNLTERITIAMIAEHCFLSEAYLCRLFKAETGTTINKYLTARRISIAKAKLAEGYAVSEACEQSGFQDYTNFVRVFTRIVGVTPKHYAKYCTG